MFSELPLTVRRDTAEPLPLQIARQIRAAVEDGRLRAGHRLPSTRDVARDLGVSRAVVQGAYDQLHAEGWITARTGAGSFIADVVPLSPSPRSRRRPPAPTPRTSVISLMPGVPYVEPRTDPGWRRAWREMSTLPIPQGYEHAAGLPELRAELAEYVARFRGIPCGPENVVVTDGTAHGLRLLLATADLHRLAIEDPGYARAVTAARDRGVPVVDVPVDEDGLRVDALADDLSAVYVTPSHQYPLGGRLPVARRNELITWARRTGALVIEDDYDSEFRYDVAPLPALAQLDLDRVVHLGTLSKRLTPAIRLGWLVASPAMVDTITEYRVRVSDWPSWPIQAAMRAMLRDGYVDRLVRRGRRRYADRSAFVCDELGCYGTIVGRDAGLHITLVLDDGLDDADVVARATRAGVLVAPLSQYRRSLPGPPGLVIGYARPSDENLVRAVKVLGEVLREVTGSSGSAA